MKITVLFLCLVVGMTACKSKDQKHWDAYQALVTKTEREYREGPDQAYKAELRFADYVKDSMRRGFAFPDKNVLVWTYPRIALAAEYSGRKDIAARMFAFAEEYREQVYPGEPVDRSGRFKTLREAVIYMDRNSGIPWLKLRKSSPNKSPEVTPGKRAPEGPSPSPGAPRL